MKATSVIIYSATVAILAASTFLSPSLYGSPWFSAMWMVFAAVLAVEIAVTKMWHRAGPFLLHISLLAILGGGALTYLTAEKGSLRLSPGEEAATFTGDDGKSIPLPSPVRLTEFNVDYYPGGVVPRNYVSVIATEGREETVSMNNILDLHGYRLMQMSYDTSGATVLSVNHDPYGMPLTYAGYILFAVGGIWLMLSPGGRFRTLLRSIATVSAIVLPAGNVCATSIYGVPRTTADSLRSRQVLYEGRVVCLNTLARDVVTKLYGSPSFRGLSPEQTLLSLKLFPEKWKNQPLLKIKDKEIASRLGIEGGYASMSQLFDSVGNYRVEGLYKTVGERKLRAVEELDEKVGIVLSLYAGNLIVTPPAGMQCLSPMRVKAELLYNSIPFTTITFIILFAGFLAGMSGFFFFRHGMSAARVALACSALLSTMSFILQWYLAQRIPLANTFETLQFATIVLEFLLLMTALRNSLILPLGMLVAGAISLVSHLVEMNPVVTPLMPVLHSGWLSLHVSLVMTSYAILCLTFINALGAMVKPDAGPRLMRFSLVMLYPGVILLGGGIFTGAVWANVSWGQYWSWDPKETWALVTMMVYALPLHGHLKISTGHRAFHIYMLCAILSVAMTYFGVNHLDSMHAY